MSYSGALTEIKALVEGISADPPWRYVERGDLEEEPGATYTARRFTIEDAGGVVAGPLTGPGSGEWMESRNFNILVTYPRQGKHSVKEFSIHDDHKAMRDVLTNRAGWAGSSHICAVLLDGNIAITRRGPVWRATMSFKAVIRA